MRSLAINEFNLANERATVREERRQRTENQANAMAMDTLYELAFDNWGYKHPTIGSMEDLDALTVERATDFFRTHYAPNNAVLALVGDFDPLLLRRRQWNPRRKANAAK